MRDELADEVVREGEHPEIMAVLQEACQLTEMGFVAVARVTDKRWIACQVLDKIEFGLDPGDELEIKTTICDDVRQSGQTIIIDEVAVHPEWSTHPIPVLYGFESYASVPIMMDDGRFYGTLCAIDPAPRVLSAPEMVERLQGLAKKLGRLLSEAVER